MVSYRGGGGGGVARPPWLSQDVVSILRVQHDLPKNLENFLPKFDQIIMKRL